MYGLRETEDVVIKYETIKFLCHHQTLYKIKHLFVFSENLAYNIINGLRAIHHIYFKYTPRQIYAVNRM